MAELDTWVNKPVSRRTLLKGAGAGMLGLTLAQAGMLRSASAASESVGDIVNIATTAEALAVTLLGGAINSAKNNGYDKKIDGLVLDILQAARAEEQYHLDYLKAAGGAPLTTSFTVPDTALLKSYDTLFKTIVTLESAFIAAYMAAAMEFASMGKPELVKVAYQIAGTEGEHRVLANYALGTRPANNVAFEKAMFKSVGGAAAALKQLGFIGGSGTSVQYSSAGIVYAHVTNTQPDGPVVNCMPAMPNGGAGGMASSSDGLHNMLGLLGVFGLGAATVGTLSRRLIAHREERAEAQANQE